MKTKLPSAGIKISWSDLFGNTYSREYATHADAWVKILLHEDAIEKGLHIAPTHSGNASFNYAAERHEILLELEDCQCADCDLAAGFQSRARTVREAYFGRSLTQYHKIDEIQLAKKRALRNAQ